MDDLDLGDMGVFDPAQMAFDVPMPTPADESLFDGVQASAYVSAPIRTMDDPGSYAPGFELPTDQGPASSPDVQMSDEGEAFGMSELPMVIAEAPEPYGGDFAQPGNYESESPAAFAAAFSSLPSDAPGAAEGIGMALGDLPPISLPLGPEAPFAGVSMAPEEAFDLQLALAPPEPSQEGFAGASEAPHSAPVGAYASDLSSGSSMGQLRQMEALSTQLFGPLGVDGGGAAPASSRGNSISIQNLNLPAARANDVIAGLLSASSGTEMDLSGLEGV